MYYLCRFMYASDRSKFSANIPDQCGHQCIIKSDVNLNEVKVSQLKQYYEIKELLENNDCEDIILEELTEEDVKTEYYNLEIISINKADL